MRGDLSLDTELLGHPQVKALESQLGPAGLLCLMRFWLFVGKAAPSGCLDSFSVGSLESAAGWTGSRGAFYEALCDHHFIAPEENSKVMVQGWHYGEGSPYLSLFQAKSPNSYPVVASQDSDADETAFDMVAVDPIEHVSLAYRVRSRVSITDEQHHALLLDIGDEMLQQCYDWLDAYKKRSDGGLTEYASDYDAIRKWVIHELLAEDIESFHFSI